MAPVTITFHTVLRNGLGIEHVNLDAATVGEALQQIDKQFGERIRTIYRLGTDVKLYEFCMLLLDGIALDFEKIDHITLKPGDELHVLPPAGGG